MAAGDVDDNGEVSDFKVEDHQKGTMNFTWNIPTLTPTVRRKGPTELSKCFIQVLGVSTPTTEDKN